MSGQQVEPRHAGKHEVQQDAVVGRAVDQVRRLRRAGRGVDRVLLLAQALAERAAEVGVIFDDQDSHGLFLPGGQGC